MTTLPPPAWVARALGRDPAQARTLVAAAIVRGWIHTPTELKTQRLAARRIERAAYKREWNRRKSLERRIAA